MPPQLTNLFSYFLDVNTEIDILKAVVIKVIDKPQRTFLKAESDILYR